MGGVFADGWGLLAALGGGLLIGLERERRKGRGSDREAAGIRSFTLAAVGGALAQALQQPALVALGGLVVVLLAAVAYARSQWRQRARDPGLTTELALFVTYLVGVLCVQQPALGAAAAVVVAALLAARERLHRFATRALSEAELHDALLLAALALVALPLLPATPLPLLGDLQPRALGLLVVLILALQAAGHVALRLFGAGAGLALSGLFAGFVSSTATIGAMGVQARHEPARRAACTAGAMLSTAATWVQAIVMLLAVAPPLARQLLPAALAGFGVALASGLWQARGAQPATGGPLRVREALLVAVLLSAITLMVGWAQRAFGVQGVFASALLSALADAHASIAALGALHTGGRLAADDAALAVLLALSANALTRAVVAFATGGRAFGARLALSLAASTAAGWALLRA
jgi:uncharacterized membrane protein (DUF4010 family)